MSFYNDDSKTTANPANSTAQTLEQKITRLQEIQQALSQKSVSLSESMPLLEEAFRLKKEIEKELETMQNKLVQLSKDESEEN
jgi:exodeoxyribonuclease VII small subunit